MATPCKVVVTGMGVVSPIGIGLDAFWDSLIHCKSGIGPITLFDASKHFVQIAGEVKNFDLRSYFPDAKPHRMARQTQLALVACQQAIENAGLTPGQLKQRAPVAMVLGISSGGADLFSTGMEVVLFRGPKRLRPSMVGACQPHAIGAALAQRLAIPTTITTLSEACPSGLNSVITATRMIREGRADMVIAGGTDSPVNSASVAGFGAVGLPSRETSRPPEEVSRPFDKDRSGVVLAEGSVFAILERLDTALARGATPCLEILGGATAMDDPNEEVMNGLSLSMDLAMKNAGVYPDGIDYVCANAFGSRLADPTEVKLLKERLGDRAYQIPVSSIRGTLGHALSAAGMSQIITCALMMKHGMIVPTANLQNPDPECDLDHVPLTPRHMRINIAMANSHGIGGENGCIIVKNVI